MIISREENRIFLNAFTVFNFYILVGVFYNLISVIVCLLYKIRRPNLLSASLMKDSNLFFGVPMERRESSQCKEGDCSSSGSGMRKFYWVADTGGTTIRFERLTWRKWFNKYENRMFWFPCHHKFKLKNSDEFTVVSQMLEDTVPGT